MSDIISVDDNNFESEVLNSKLPVLVDFGAPWCGPCVRQIPILAKFAMDNPHVKVCKVDIDDSPSLAAKFDIRSVPSILIFKNGIYLGIKVGLLSPSHLNEFISEMVRLNAPII